MAIIDTQINSKNYCNSLVSYSRRDTREVKIGDLGLGGENPIRIQSMTTIDTMDTKGSVEQSIRMIEAGCELVRITAPSIKEAQNLDNIKQELRDRGYSTPLVADIHFTPNAAEVAARIVEKVRVNPGNYADKKKFQVIEYTDNDYEAELERIRQKFTPLVQICKEYGTAMRIGTNHGSLSDRILSRYGDTPLGMVESALEFLRICEDLNYYEIVLSMKASNTQVMVQAYRLLVNKLEEEGLQPYPLHLGVTEAGEAEDGRIKSAVGIGTLLEDGLGDTVRVSLTEEPEFEAPVAKALVDRYANRRFTSQLNESISIPYNPFSYHRRDTNAQENIGYENVPRVIGDLSFLEEIATKHLEGIGHFYLPELDKWAMNDFGADYVYSGDNPISFMLPNGLKEVMNYQQWIEQEDKEHKYPLLRLDEILTNTPTLSTKLNFILAEVNQDTLHDLQQIKDLKNIVLVLTSNDEHAMSQMRRFFMEMLDLNFRVPVIIKRAYDSIEADKLLLYSSTDIGGLLIDGFGDGVMLSSTNANKLDDADVVNSLKFLNETSFGILQAARTRMSKTEYISCPSCGRTLFDLQETTAMIRKRTDHLKGVKIGIMGCIVNGPGEMADADFGYVGSGPGKITLYKGQEVVKKGIPSDKALDELINLIKENGRWTEPETSLT